MLKTKCPRCGNLAHCFGDICNACYRELNPPKPNYSNRLDMDLDPEEYRDKVKKTCSWCGHKLPGTLKHYMEHGNACKDVVRCKDRRTLKNDGYLSDIRILV